MGYSKVMYSLPVRAVTLLAGGVLATGGALEWGTVALVAGIGLVVVAIVLTLKMQQAMRENSLFMLEAVKNGDYSFKLNTNGVSAYERIMQDTLNRFGELMGKQKLQMEQQEQFFWQILSNVTTGVVVLDESMKIILSNPVASTLLHVPALTTLQQLERHGSDIPDVLRNLGGGSRVQLDYFTTTGDVHLLVKASEMWLGEKRVKILAISDIKNELDAKELETWIRLTRVLTHEIMNSVSPIVSLSETFLRREDVKNSSLSEGIQAIHETSAGLISFVNNYRIISTLQKPKPEPFCLIDIVKPIEGLNLIPKNIKFQYHIEPPELIIYADPNLIRQVLMNIVKNAIQAIDNNAEGRIYLKAFASADDHVFVYISNNGPVIPKNEAEEIFVPFFTTKRDGNGVGLSLSRQIMKMSGGSISLLDAGYNGWNTTFLLEFE